MPTISREYHAHAGRYQPGGNSCDYIVVHNTGNSASALAEAKNQQNNFSRPAGAHYFLDGGGVIYQLLDDTDTAWAVGAWSGARQLISNYESISIEVCSDGVEFTDAEIEELTWLVQLLMERHDIPAKNVVRHWDCHTGRKECPAYYVPMNRWYALHKTITEGDTMSAQNVWEYPIGRDATPGKQNMPAWMTLSWTNHDTAWLYQALAKSYNSPKKNTPQSGWSIADRICMLDKYCTDLSKQVPEIEKKVEALDKKIDQIINALKG